MVSKLTDHWIYKSSEDIYCYTGQWTYYSHTYFNPFWDSLIQSTCKFTLGYFKQHSVANQNQNNQTIQYLKKSAKDCIAFVSNH